MFKSKSKPEINAQLKHAKQLIVSGDFVNALTLYCDDEFLKKNTQQCGAEDAEHYYLCGHALQQFYMMYIEQVAEYEQKVAQYNENNLSNPMAATKPVMMPELAVKPELYLQKAEMCFKNSVNILLSHQFTSEQALKSVCKAYQKLIQIKKALGLDGKEVYDEFTQWKVVMELKPKLYEFMTDDLKTFEQ